MRAKLIGVIVVTLATVGSAAVADTISNLEVYYAFEDDANFGVNSVGLDGVPGAGVWSSDTGPVGFGQAADFGSALDSLYIDVAGKSNPGDAALTLATWFKTDNSTDLLTAIHSSGSVSGDAIALVLSLGQPAVLMGEAGSDPAANALAHGVDMADGLWHHMAMTFTGGVDDTLTLYVDGQFSAERTQSAGSFDVDGWSVGSSYNGTQYFAGSMDDTRMYSRALNADDVAQLHNPAVPEPGTLMLLACGLLSLAAFCRLRGRK